VTIGKPADEVWDLIGDFGDLTWLPNATSLQLDGEVRTFQLGESTVRHRLLRHDDATRCYTYALADVTADTPAAEATITVVEDGPTACIVTWDSDTDRRRGSPEALGAFFQGLLDQLRTNIERTRPVRAFPR
jgi:hypothetical protein